MPPSAGSGGGRSRQKGYFTVYRKTMGKRMAARLKSIQQRLRQRMHAPSGDTGKGLISVVRGYFQYHAVPDNVERLGNMLLQVEILRPWPNERFAAKHPR